MLNTVGNDVSLGTWSYMQALLTTPPAPSWCFKLCCCQRVGAHAGHLSVFIYLCMSFPERSEPPAELINAVFWALSPVG